MTKVLWQRVFKLVCPVCNAVAEPIGKDGPITIYKNTCPKCNSTMEEVISEETYEEEEVGEINGLLSEGIASLPTVSYVDSKGTTFRVIRNPYDQFMVRRRPKNEDGWKTYYIFPNVFRTQDEAQNALDKQAEAKEWRVVQ